MFAFAVEMPLSHRLACLRDDIVFFGFLYQRWIYPVDKKRVNEFGRAYEDKPAEIGGAPTATDAAGKAGGASLPAADAVAKHADAGRDGAAGDAREGRQRLPAVSKKER